MVEFGACQSVETKRWRISHSVADRHEHVAVAAVVVEADLGEHGEVAGDPRPLRRHLGEPDVRHVVADDAPHARILGRRIR